MNKIDDLTLMAYMDGELNDAERGKVRQALADDDGSRRMLDNLQEQDALVEAVLNEALTTPMPEIAALNAVDAAVAPARPSLWRQIWDMWSQPALWAPMLLVLGLAGVLGGIVGQDRAWNQAQQLYAGLGGLDRQAEVLARQVLNRALESELSGKTVSWEHPDLGQRGRVTPVRTYRTEGGVYCREFLEERMTNGERISLKGVACRIGESWQLRTRTSTVL